MTETERAPSAHSTNSLDGVLTSQDAGTPFALPADLSADALAALEFDQVLGLIAAHAVSPLGARRVRARRPTDDLPWIREELAAVAEARELLVGNRGLIAEPVPDVTPTLQRLRVPGSRLEGSALADLLRLLNAARLVAAELRRIAEEAPRCAAHARPVPDRAVERRLELAVDPDGSLLDTASPALAAARGEVRSTRSRLIQKLESILRGLGGGGDGTVTVRNGRYVIPIPRDLRGRPGGIVHDESASGSTLFVEPQATIELGNLLRAAEAREEREALTVLRDLTDLLRPLHPVLCGAFDMCVAVDDLAARAAYARAVDGHLPSVATAPARLAIVNGRHPLLLSAEGPVRDLALSQERSADPPARRSAIIPFDLTLEDGERTVLLSGPNTGGKSVLLKAVGLLAVMTQSGIIPPVGPGTTLPVFGRFFADIGDRQSIAASLSTFSAHVAALRRMLDQGNDASLILLDEVGSGTDPAEGAALASAALLSFTRRGSLTLATTHLGSLKQLAAHSSGVVNASLQFDAATLRPTYRLLKGVPGRSYGLAIARRLGIPEPVLSEAEAQLPDAEKSLDALLGTVEAHQRELAVRESDLGGRAVEMDALQARLSVQAESQAEREADLKRRERDAERSARTQAKAYLLEARQRVEQALGMARAAVDEVTAREARRLVEEGVKAEAEALALEQAEEAGGAEAAIVTGMRVRLKNGTTGRVAELRGDGKLVVTAGGVKLVVGQHELAGVLPSSAPSASGPAAPAALASSAPFDIDLRGLTGDEAEQALLAAVDAAVLADNPYLRIIHGKGTGVVRDRVRRVLAADRRVTRSEFAPANQGGTGVTVAELRPMSMIPEEVIDEVRETADLVGIIGESVDLRRTGSDYRGPCPFHGGTHRNFAVIPRKRQFYCFVCKESGDIFSYFMKRFGMDYPTAVREVAQRSGITIPERPSREGPDPNAPLFTALSAAQDWFTRQLRELPEAQVARDYLVKERALDLEAVEPFDLGFAPRGAAFLSAMTQLGLGERALLEAGLLVRREDGSIVPRFRGRLLFPIHDLRGRVVGFGGRLLGPGEPKYLNSPETPVFHKGSMLYNLHQAKQAIRKEGSFILVEGYFDVLRLVLAGLEQVVAPMGTALTPEQAAVLKRFAPQATLLLDSDPAGLRATFRAGDELLRHEVRVRVATMPAGDDPDTLVRTGGAAALEPILRDAIDVLERKIQILDRKGWFSDVEHRREALDRLLPTLRATKDPITRELYLSRVAERAGIDKRVLADEVSNAPPEPASFRPAIRTVQPRPRLVSGRPPEWVRSEQRLLEVVLHSPDFLDRARREVRPEWFEAADFRRVFEALVAGDSLPDSLPSESQAVWSKLKENAANLGDQSLDQIYVEACQVLEARPLLRELRTLDSRIESAPEELKLGLAEEKRTRLRDLSTRFPDTWARLHSSRKYRQETKTREPNP